MDEDALKWSALYRPSGNFMGSAKDLIAIGVGWIAWILILVSILISSSVSLFGNDIAM